MLLKGAQAVFKKEFILSNESTVMKAICVTGSSNCRIIGFVSSRGSDRGRITTTMSDTGEQEETHVFEASHSESHSPIETVEAEDDIVSALQHQVASLEQQLERKKREVRRLRATLQSTTEQKQQLEQRLADLAEQTSIDVANTDTEPLRPGRKRSWLWCCCFPFQWNSQSLLTATDASSAHAPRSDSQQKHAATSEKRQRYEKQGTELVSEAS